MNSSRDYMLVVQAPAYALDADTFALESAFAAHLRELRQLLASRFDQIVLVAPQYTREQYEAQAPHLARVSAAADGIRFLPAYTLGLSRPAFWFGHLGRVWRLLVEQARRSGVVHSGMSTALGHPIMFMACLAGKRVGRPVVFMTDIDFRMHSVRYRQLGVWNWRQYLVNHYVYDPLKWVQLWLAPRLFDLVCLKSASMVRDFGGGRPNVRNFFDTVHALKDVLDDERLASRLARLRQPGQPLRAVYFGRLVGYKGLDRTLEGVRLARQRGCDVRMTFIGAGEQLEALRRLADDPSLAGAVEFHDPVPYGTALFERLEAADVALATPLVEDTPRAAFDAMARGIPLVAFDITYFRDLAGESGAVALARWPEPGEVAARLIELAGDRERLATMARKGVEFARQNTQAIWLDRRIGWTLQVAG